MSSPEACVSCLRRALLIARLAPRIAGLLDRPRARVAGLLALPEPELLRVAAGRSAEPLVEELDRLDMDEVRERLEGRGIVAFCAHSRAYPPPLLDLDDPPAVLFALGRVDLLDAFGQEPSVAIVGTRNPSPYGNEVAYSLGRGLGAAGVPVVSGLALGIDATAHRGCIAGNGIPVAVLGCGPDVVYPRRHRRLHERIRESGLVLAELPPGTRPFRWSFPARNRIMAGLARMTVVVEAADPSGSLITTDFARDLGRSVAAVPGRVTSRIARGTNGLLRDGAVPITAAEDVLDELFGVGMRQVPSATGERREPDDPRLARVLEAAERSTSVGAIAAATGLGSAETRAALGRLEAEGWLVRRDLGGWERTLGGGTPLPGGEAELMGDEDLMGREDLLGGGAGLMAGGEAGLLGGGGEDLLAGGDDDLLGAGHDGDLLAGHDGGFLAGDDDDLPAGDGDLLAGDDDDLRAGDDDLLRASHEDLPARADDPVGGDPDAARLGQPSGEGEPVPEE